MFLKGRTEAVGSRDL